jgi:hypothetical protein
MARNASTRDESHLGGAMSPDHDSRFTQEDPEDDFDEEEGSRSIFSATWFRAVLVLLGIAVIGVVAVPYVLDVVNPPVEPPKIATAPPTPAPAAPGPTVSATPPPPSAAAPSSSTVTPAPSPESAKAPASSPAPKTTPPVAVAEAPKPAPSPRKEPARETPRSDAPDRTAAKSAPAEKAAPKKAAAAKATANGDYFVQVGAFKDQAMAMSVAARLRQQNYSVVESVVRIGGAAPAAAPRSTPPPPAPRVAAAVQAGPDRYDVIVSGAPPADMNAKLTAKGLAAEPAGDGMRIRPSLPLRDAVALSKDLGSEGFRVQVRRAGGAEPPAPAPAPPAPARPAPSASDGDGQTLHRVRVGGFPDRAAAQAALRELQDKGFQPFIAKGRE